MAHHGGLASPSSAAISPQQLGFSNNHHHVIVPPPRPPAPSLPRVHRPRMPIMTPPPPTTIILQPLNGGGGTTTTTPASPVSTQQRRRANTTTEVSLTAPRPDGERTVNEYVETPFRPANDHHEGSGGGGGGKNSNVAELVRGGEGRLSGSSLLGGGRTTVTSNIGGVVVSGGRREPPHHQALHLPIGGSTNKKDVHHHHPRLQRGVVTKQPGAAATFKKDVAPGSSGGGTGGGGVAIGAIGSGGGSGRRGAANAIGSGGGGDCFQSGSIICPACGRCRCESCRQPRPLPSKWLCNNACFCSAETSLDYVSCLCCVKGFFYHCSKDYEHDGTASCADDPCSCGPHRFFARWGCLAAFSLIMPCLWCYWPLKGCVGLCEKCYARYSSQGCRCEPRRDPKLSDLTPEKRLLDTSPEF